MKLLAAVHWPGLALFAAAMLAATLHVLAASGHFPAAQRSTTMRGSAGTAILWGSTALVAAAVLTALAMALRLQPWPVVVIAAGIGVLVAPLVLQHLPDSFVDGRRGLLVLGTAAGILAWLQAGLG